MMEMKLNILRSEYNQAKSTQSAKLPFELDAHKRLTIIPKPIQCKDGYKPLKKTADQNIVYSSILNLTPN